MLQQKREEKQAGGELASLPRRRQQHGAVTERGRFLFLFLLLLAWCLSFFKTT
jgi:hypothetical protein